MQPHSNNEIPLDQLLTLSPEQAMEEFLKQAQEMSSAQLLEEFLKDIREMSPDYSMEKLLTLSSEQLIQLSDELSQKRMQELSQRLKVKQGSVSALLGFLQLVGVSLFKLKITSLDKKLLSQLSKKFPEQWTDFEYVFRDLEDVRQWDLRRGNSPLVVKLRYRRDCLYTWSAFLIAIALSSIRKAFYRLS